MERGQCSGHATGANYHQCSSSRVARRRLSFIVMLELDGAATAVSFGPSPSIVVLELDGVIHRRIGRSSSCPSWLVTLIVMLEGPYRAQAWHPHRQRACLHTRGFVVVVLNVLAVDI
jgi:hypothetical protein